MRSCCLTPKGVTCGHCMCMCVCVDLRCVFVYVYSHNQGFWVLAF
jgi:hypothetical protein